MVSSTGIAAHAMKDLGAGRESIELELAQAEPEP